MGLLLLAACTPNAPVSTHHAALATPIPATVAPLTFQPGPAAVVAAGGCGSSTVYSDGIPASLDEAGGHNNPNLPYVVANPPIAAGFLFAYPLKSGPIGNKILWVVGAPRHGEPIAIDAHPYGADQPIVYFNKDANSSPGEIYPSGIVVPSAGCWVLSLRWGTNRAEADLVFG